MPPAALAQPTLEPPAPDWMLARILYASGVAMPTIARQLHVTPEAVRQRSCREDWSRYRQMAQSHAVTAIRSVVHESLTPELRGLIESSAKTKQALAHELLASVDTLSSVTPNKRMDAQEQRARVLHTLAQAGRVLHGWGGDEQQGPVRITTISAQVIMRATGTQAQAQAPATDAECSDASAIAESTQTLPPA